MANVGGDAEDVPNARSRWRVSMRETDVLEAVFASSPRPNKNTIQQLATLLTVKPRQVQVWFQNRRQRWRKDFLELERTRDVHLVDISGKALDFQSDSLPAGWDSLLGTGVAADADATSSITIAPTAVPGELAVRATLPSSSADSLSTAEPPRASLKDEVLHMDAVEIDALNELDLCDLLSFTPVVAIPPAECARKTAPLTIQLPPPDRDEHSILLSLNCTPTPTSKDMITPSSDGDDTIWVGMEWLVPETATN